MQDSFDEVSGLGSRSVGSDAPLRNDPGPAELARASCTPRKRGRARVPDALSEVLRLVRLTGAVFLNAELTAPWAVQTPSAKQLAAQLLPDAEWFVEYHLIVEGECWIRLPDGEPVHLRAGDLVMLPHGDSHRLSSEPGLQTRAVDGAALQLPAYGEIVQHSYRRWRCADAHRLRLLRDRPHACAAACWRRCRASCASTPAVVTCAVGCDTYMHMRAAGRSGLSSPAAPVCCPSCRS